jgi:hypothetical protein
MPDVSWLMLSQNGPFAKYQLSDGSPLVSMGMVSINKNVKFHFQSKLLLYNYGPIYDIFEKYDQWSSSRRIKCEQDYTNLLPKSSENRSSLGISRNFNIHGPCTHYYYMHCNAHDDAWQCMTKLQSMKGGRACLKTPSKN